MDRFLRKGSNNEAWYFCHLGIVVFQGRKSDDAGLGHRQPQWLMLAKAAAGVRGSGCGAGQGPDSEPGHEPWALAGAGWKPSAFYQKHWERSFPRLFLLHRNNSSKQKCFWREPGRILCSVPMAAGQGGIKLLVHRKWKWKVKIYPEIM